MDNHSEMSNKEAIRRIRDHISVHFAEEYPRGVLITEALTKAITALEILDDAENFLDNDLISRSALKDEVNKKNVVGRFNTLLLIDEAPAVKPSKLSLIPYIASDYDMAYMRGKEKGLIEGILRGMGKITTGKWIATGRTDEHYGYVYQCSECGETEVCIARMKFCPYCGAALEIDKGE